MRRLLDSLQLDPVLHPITLDSSRGLAILPFEGDVSGRDLLTARQALVSKEKWCPSLDEVWDFSEASVGLDPETLNRIASEVRDHPETHGPCRVVIVTRNTDLETITGLLDRRLRRYGRAYLAASTLEDALECLQEPASKPQASA